MYAFRFGSGGGGVVAYHAGHHLDSSNQRLLHRTTGDRGVAFQHIEHFSVDIAEHRTGHHYAATIGPAIYACKAASLSNR